MSFIHNILYGAGARVAAWFRVQQCCGILFRDVKHGKVVKNKTF